MGLPTELGMWGIILALAIGVFSNLITPLVARLFRTVWGISVYVLAVLASGPVYWLARWGRNSLEKKIIKLEAKLAELEKTPPIDPVQNEMLWAMKTTKIHAISISTWVIFVVYFGVRVLADPNAVLFREFTNVVFLFVFLGMVDQLRMRYQWDFRRLRAPGYREGLRKTTTELKELREKWDDDMLDTKPQ